jgi:hypothetical protein
LLFHRTIDAPKEPSYAEKLDLSEKIAAQTSNDIKYYTPSVPIIGMGQPQSLFGKKPSQFVPAMQSDIKDRDDASPNLEEMFAAAGSDVSDRLDALESSGDSSPAYF